MSIELERFSWLFIGLGLGIILGEEDGFMLIFGMVFVSLGFLFSYLNNKEWSKK